MCKLAPSINDQLVPVYVDAGCGSCFACCGFCADRCRGKKSLLDEKSLQSDIFEEYDTSSSNQQARLGLHFHPRMLGLLLALMSLLAFDAAPSDATAVRSIPFVLVTILFLVVMGHRIASKEPLDSPSWLSSLVPAAMDSFTKTTYYTKWSWYPLVMRTDVLLFVLLLSALPFALCIALAPELPGQGTSYFTVGGPVSRLTSAGATMYISVCFFFAIGGAWTPDSDSTKWLNLQYKAQRKQLPAAAFLRRSAIELAEHDLEFRHYDRFAKCSFWFPSIVLPTLFAATYILIVILQLDEEVWRDMRSRAVFWMVVWCFFWVTVSALIVLHWLLLADFVRLVSSCEFAMFA